MPIGAPLALVPFAGKGEIVTLLPQAELGPQEVDEILGSGILLQIALTLRCDTTRMVGLQTGNRDFDESYGDNHVLFFQFKPLMW